VLDDDDDGGGGTNEVLLLVPPNDPPLNDLERVLLEEAFEDDRLG
jgi:hypothetical protein